MSDPYGIASMSTEELRRAREVVACVIASILADDIAPPPARVAEFAVLNAAYRARLS